MLCYENMITLVVAKSQILPLCIRNGISGRQVIIHDVETPDRSADSATSTNQIFFYIIMHVSIISLPQVLL